MDRERAADSARVYVAARIETIDYAEMDRYRRGTYLLTTITPLVNGPKRNVYTLNQAGLDDFLDHYGDFGEFIIELTKIPASPEGGAT